MLNFEEFSEIFPYLIDLFPPEANVHSENWQGVNISKKPEMAMHEILNFSFQTLLHTVSDDETGMNYYRSQIKPNLPWADDHFEERVDGQPLNPGDTWTRWPYANSANKFRDARGQFNHNYMERYFPKFANTFPDGKLQADMKGIVPHYGIRQSYGDLNDVVQLLWDDPYTRQAYLPVWFPEDTGRVELGRKPCTLGYHFIMRNNELHIIYYIRSCDFIRHFRDDIYLTVRLLLWVLNQLRTKGHLLQGNSKWDKVLPGTFTMHITSLHMFRNDYLMLPKGE